MIGVVICLVCTLLNTAWGIYWSKRLNKETKMYKIMDMCRKSIASGVCPKCCEKCAWNIERYEINGKRRNKKKSR